VTEFRTEWFTFPMSTKVAALVTEILDELIDRNGLSLPEAVARINAQWGAFDMTSPTDIVLHETDFYWATVILYEEPIPDWWEGADRLSWTRRAAPPVDSGCWTLSGAPG
jgi:hypothetical protein